MRRRNTIRWANLLSLMRGIWLLFAPGVLGLVTGGAIANSVVFGVLVVCASLWSLGVAPSNVGPAEVNLAFAVWTFISPWVLAYAFGGPSQINALVTGVLLGVLSLLRMSQRASRTTA